MWKTPKGAPLSPRPFGGPSATVLAIGGTITCVDAPALCERVRQLLKEGEAESVICDVGAVAGADVGTVDVLARLQLTARRRGSRIRLRNASCELQELLGVVGLADVLRPER